ncbi:MAG: FkbM family methyltransferase [Rhodospirillales bacterium]|nr:FkbM family methyltransferase [Acetobacter sp.]
MNPVKRLSPFKSACRWLSFHTSDFPTKLRWLHLVFRPEMRSADLYELPLLATVRQAVQAAGNTEIGRQILLFGLYEKPCAAAFHRLLGPGDVVLDIGANIGQYTLLAAEKVGAAGKVMAIEATPHIFERLRRHVEANGLDNVLLMPCAVGVEEGSIAMKVIADDNDGMHHVSLTPGEAGTTPVPLRRVDDLLTAALPGRAVDVVKIDVEGWEEAVFAGAEMLFRQNVPPTIFFESIEAHAVRFGFSAKRLGEQFTSHGYRLFSLHEASGRWQPVSEVGLEETFYNSLAVHPRRPEHLRAIGQ